MFIQHRQLRHLQVSAAKVSHLHRASGSVQLAFPGYLPQLCNAYLLQIAGDDKTLVVVAFYLKESQSSIFFVPKQGEVPAKESERVYEEGYVFVESMGFVLTETDYHLFSAEKRHVYWKSLPICQPPKNPVVTKPSLVKNSVENVSATEETMNKLRSKSLQSMGRFMASM